MYRKVEFKDPHLPPLQFNIYFSNWGLEEKGILEAREVSYLSNFLVPLAGWASSVLAKSFLKVLSEC